MNFEQGINLITAREVASILGRSVTTVNRAVAAGDLRPILQSPGSRGARFFSREAVERYAYENGTYRKGEAALRLLTHEKQEKENGA